jgi:hypothetical protein
VATWVVLGAGTLWLWLTHHRLSVLLLWDRSQPEGALLLGTITAGLATLWAVLGAPALSIVLGLGGTARPRSPSCG